MKAAGQTGEADGLELILPGRTGQAARLLAPHHAPGPLP